MPQPLPYQDAIRAVPAERRSHRQADDHACHARAVRSRRPGLSRSQAERCRPALRFVLLPPWLAIAVICLASCSDTRGRGPRRAASHSPSAPRSRSDGGPQQAQSSPQATGNTHGARQEPVATQQRNGVRPAPRSPSVSQSGDRRAAQNGIRRLEARHLVLHTDLPSSAAVDALPHWFTQAVGLWAEYFGIKPARLAAWQPRASLMQSRERFRQAGLLPDDLPEFPHGYARGKELWLDDQPTAYYRRHLLLHEGVHAFMDRFLGGAGPPWYREGMAELLATHTVRSGKLEIAYFPARRDDVPLLNRIQLVQRAVAEEGVWPLEKVLAMGPRAHRSNEAYAWSWAAAVLLDTHPAYQQPFRALTVHVTDPAFNRRLRDAMRERWTQLAEEWELFASTLDHGHNIVRTAIDFRAGRPRTMPFATSVRADRGWQNTGLWLDAGVKYPVAATGRFEVADDPRPWWCEADGVTIRYYRGRPLGMLLATVWSSETAGNAAFVSPRPIGSAGLIVPAHAGTLFVKVNESPGDLDDNRGSLEITVRALPD